MDRQPCAIGVDLGGTKVETALVDSSGNIIQRILEPTKVSEGSSAIIKGIVASVQKLQHLDDRWQPTSIGVAVAGQIDKSGGLVQFSPNLYWHHIPLRNELSKALNIPVVLVNDVRAATIGEWWYGEGVGSKDIICLFVGTGIGGGIVSDGHLLTGATNSAGELGHVTVQLDGPLCTCGNRGCIEALAGGWAIAEIARQAILLHPEEGNRVLQLAGGERLHVTAKHVITAALEGDSFAQSLMEDVAKALIGNIVSLVNAFNPERIILGGGIMNNMPQLIQKIDQGVRKLALKVAIEKLTIAPSKLKGDAGIIGATALALRSNSLIY